MTEAFDLSLDPEEFRNLANNKILSNVYEAHKIAELRVIEILK